MDTNSSDVQSIPAWIKEFEGIVVILSTRVKQLDSAIAVAMKVVEETSEAPTFATLLALNSTADAYRARYLFSSEKSDLQESILLKQRFFRTKPKVVSIIDSLSDPTEKENAMKIGDEHRTLKEIIDHFYSDLPASLLQKVILSSMDCWIHSFQSFQNPRSTVDIDNASNFLIILSKVLMLRFQASKEMSDLNSLLAFLLDASDLYPVQLGPLNMDGRRVTLFFHFLLLNEFRHSVLGEEGMDTRHIEYYQSPQNRSQSRVHPLGIMVEASRAHLERYKATEERYYLDVTVRLLTYLINHPRLDPTSDLWDPVQEQLVQMAEAYYKTLPDLNLLSDREKQLFHSQNLAYDFLLKSSFIALVDQCQSVITSEDLDSDQTKASLDMVVQRILLPPPDHPLITFMVCRFAAIFVERYLSKQDHKTIEFALQALQRVVPPSPPTYPWISLAGAFQKKYEEDQKLSHLDEADAIFQAGLEYFRPENTSKIDILEEWATLKLTRFEGAGNPEDLEASIKLYEECISVGRELGAPQPVALSELASALVWKSKLSGQETLLTKAVDLCREAKNASSLKDETKVVVLGNLAHCLRARVYTSEGDPTDLREAEQASIDLTSLEGNGDLLSSICRRATIVWSHFDSQGAGAYLDEAINMFQQAMPLVDGRLDSGAQQFLNSYGVCLTNRFERDYRPEDLEAATKLHERALALRRNGHPSRADSLTNLAYCRLNAFQETGDRQLLDESIEMYREAIDRRPFPHSDRPSSLSNLANALKVRYRFSSYSEDALEALRIARQAAGMYTGRHPYRLPALNNLIGPLTLAFQTQKNPAYLEEAIGVATSVLEGRNELELHPHGLSSFHNLASLLLQQYTDINHDEHTLQRAISMQTQAVDSVPSNHPLRSRFYEHLATMLQARFQRSKDKSDLLKAAQLINQALDLEPPPHLYRFSLLDARADLLRSQYSECEPKDRKLLEEAVDAVKAAISYPFSSPSQRFIVCQKWVFFAESTDHPSILDAHRTRLLLLLELVNMTPGSRDRQEILLNGSDGMARAAALCFIKEGKLEEAIELLELGRAVFWSQMLKLRTPLDRLQQADPSLARKWQEVSSALELAFHRDTSPIILDGDDKAKLQHQHEVATVNRLTDSLSKILAEIRNLKGFEDFLKPRSFNSIKRAVKRWPIVFLIPGKDQSCALVLTRTDVQKVALKNAPQKKIQGMVQRMQNATGAFGIRFGDQDSQKMNEPAEEQASWSTSTDSNAEKRTLRPVFQIHGEKSLQLVLKALWTDVVQPVIEALGSTKENQPILRWCPVGLFGFLPIHAAGIYESASGEVDCVSEYAVSSYVPAIEVLLQNSEEPRNNRVGPENVMLAVVDKKLSSAKKEIEEVEKIAGKEDIRFMKLGLNEASQATVASVVEILSKARIAHFACHGKQDAAHPLDSYLKLEDGKFLLSTILRDCHIQGSELAFLCACETATGDERAPDEAMSLGSCLVYSGFRSVVATMWEIHDEDGPVVASAFYEELFKERKENENSTLSSEPIQSGSNRDFQETLDSEEASARALHCAMKTLRHRPDISFKRWLPFVHISGRGSI